MTDEPTRSRVWTSRAVLRRQRAVMWKKQGGRCYLCGRAMTYPKPIHENGVTRYVILDHSARTIDHRIPLSRGGADTIANKALACSRCNLLKGRDTEEEFRERWFCYPGDPTFDPELHLPTMPAPFSRRRAEKEEALFRRLYEILEGDK